MNTILIADVSKHDGVCNFNTMKKAGVKAVIIRAGYRGYKSGGLATDEKWAENVKKASAAGLPIGAYWWTQATSKAEAIQEAEKCVQLIGSVKLAFPIWLDLEFYNGKKEGRADHLSAKARTDYALAFINRCNELGFSAGIYCNPDFWRHDLDSARLATLPRWIAHYNATGAGMECDIWQYSSTGKGKTYGVQSQYIDLNKMYTNFPGGESSKFAPTGNPYPEPVLTVTSKKQAEAQGCKTFISSGDGVRHIQWELARLGCDLGTYGPDHDGIDGECGAKTVHAIEAIQEAHMLTVDGLAGPATREALNKAVAALNK